MRKLRLLVFGALLLGGVGVAVGGLVAQAPAPAPQPEPRARMMMLDGRGAALGVTVRDLSADDLKAAGAQHGVRIDDLDTDGPGAKAGLRAGDLVVEVDGERVRSARQFARVIQETPEGRSVNLGIIRDGSRQTLTATPEARGFAWNWGFDSDRIGRDVARSLRDLEPRLREIEPRLRDMEPRLRDLEPRLRDRMREFHFDAPDFDFDFDFDFDGPWMTNPRGRLGIQIEGLTPQLGEYFGAKDGGVLVAGVTADSPAAKAGLKAGDVITSIDGASVRSYNELLDELRGKSGEITVGIIRDKQASSVKVTIEPARSRTRSGRPGV